MILEQRYFSTDELAELLRVRKNTVEKWRNNRSCPFSWTKVCGRILFDRDEVLKYLESNKRKSIHTNTGV